ncbi:TerB N-terminal domain-containing protein [Yersinia ruckeri]
MIKIKSAGTGRVIFLMIILGLLSLLPKETSITVGAALLCVFFFWRYLKAAKNTTTALTVDAPPLLAEATVVSLDEIEPSLPQPSDDEFYIFQLSDELNKQNYQAPVLPQGSLSRASWLPPGELAVVAGINLPDGMIYIGNKLKSNRHGAEPAFINPTLKVAVSDVDITLPLTDERPNYSTLSPEARRAYLQWLADGRQSPHAHIGYVFLFFYGLEHRLLIDANVDAAAKNEQPVLKAEIIRLLSIYGEHRAFEQSGRHLLAYLTPLDPSEKTYLSAPQTLDGYGNDLPLAVKIGLGQLAMDQYPLPPEWAVAWALSDPNLPHNRAATRNFAVFSHLFQQRYQQHFPQGLILPINRTKLQICYRSASTGLMDQQFTRRIYDLPDVVVAKENREKIRLILNECYAELETYSQFIALNPDKINDLEAVLLLPMTLWPAELQQALENIKERVGYGLLLMTYRELFSRLKSPGEVTRNKVAALVKALEKMQLGVEPDILTDNITPSAQDTIALFPITLLKTESETLPAYRVTVVTLDLACAAVMVDGSISEPELNMLCQHIDAWGHLSPGQRMRLKAYLQPGIKKASTLGALRKKLEPLNVAIRRAIARFLSHLIQADGKVTPQEVKFLERVYLRLSLDNKLVYTDLQQPGATKGRILTDTVRVAQLQQESRAVYSVLQNMFSTPSAQPASSPIQPLSTWIKPVEIFGLDVDHSALLRFLLSRLLWSRNELLDVAADMGLPLDDALHLLNERMQSQFNLPLTQGDNQVKINPEILRSLAA